MSKHNSQRSWAAPSVALRRSYSACPSPLLPQLVMPRERLSCGESGIINWMCSPSLGLMICIWISELKLIIISYKPEVQFRGSGSGVAVVVGLLLAREPGVAASVPAVAAAKPAHCSLLSSRDLKWQNYLYFLWWVLFCCFVDMDVGKLSVWCDKIQKSMRMPKFHYQIQFSRGTS